ncbi:MAG TPA: 3-oxoacid CoA-transferase subunit A [Candidatus Binatia bacterium]|jgi:3-oxoacid CoA-transferase|nr:3-oxoacid CoA-transferase subunit A [Candidatus Binatia bacterium]
MDKVHTLPEGIADISEGATIAVSGFGVAHNFPSTLIGALRERGTRNLTVVSNSLGIGEHAPEVLVANRQVSRLIVSFSARPGVDSMAEQLIREGLIDLELVPQGILVERMRAAAAGLPAFYSPTTVGTPLAYGKELREFDGRPYVLERALPVDFAFLRALRADRVGNVEFRGSSQNFNPSFGKGARVAIVEADEIVEEGEIPPDRVGLPGVFVTRVVQSTVSHEVAPSAARRRPADSAREYDGKRALTRTEIAERASRLLPDGSYVNLGTGLPNLVANYLLERDVRLHSENGVLSYGPRVADGDVDPDLYDAGGGFVTPRRGMSFFDSVTSFEIARSGRLTAVVLGGYQVDGGGNLANWSTPDQVGGGIGGAMDLIAGGSTLIIVMEHLDSQGRPKLVDECTYPLTGQGCVDVVVTDVGLFRFRDGHACLEEVAPGFTADEVLAMTGFRASKADPVREMR